MAAWSRDMRYAPICAATCDSRRQFGAARSRLICTRRTAVQRSLMHVSKWRELSYSCARTIMCNDIRSRQEDYFAVDGAGFGEGQRGGHVVEGEACGDVGL